MLHGGSTKKVEVPNLCSIKIIIGSILDIPIHIDIVSNRQFTEVLNAKFSTAAELLYHRPFHLNEVSTSSIPNERNLYSSQISINYSCCMKLISALIW